MLSMVGLRSFFRKLKKNWISYSSFEGQKEKAKTADLSTDDNYQGGFENEYLLNYGPRSFDSIYTDHRPFIQANRIRRLGLSLSPVLA